jgi:hypothetical protein
MPHGVGSVTAMKRTLLTVIVSVLMLCVAQGYTALFDAGISYAQDSWQTEFDEVCSKTQDAMELDSATLKELIKRCDALKSSIEQLTGAQKKVYLRRLKMCRDLYVYVLESKERQ